MIIVHVITRFLRAGSEENTLATCKAQIEAGNQVYLIHGRDYDLIHYENRLQGLNLIKLDLMVHPISILFDIKATLVMAKLFKELSPNVVHTHQSKAGILGRVAAKMAKVPIIVHGVHIVPFSNVGLLPKIIYLVAEKLAASITTAFVSVSHGTQKAYLDKRIGAIDKHYVVHSGFDLARFIHASPPNDSLNILGVESLENKPFAIVMVAAFEPRKRHSEFLDAIKDQLHKHGDVRVVFVGEGPCRELIENKIDSLNLRPMVHVTGFRTDPESLIEIADVCVLTSTREGLPRVVMQYLAAGKPCVVTDIPGIDEVVLNGVNGVVVPSGDLDGVVRELFKLKDNPDYIYKLKQGALATNLTSWDVNNMGYKMAYIYDECAKKIGGV